MNSSSSSVVPLQFASLCLDCEMITAAGGRCAACGSSALMNVARTLSGPMTTARPVSQAPITGLRYRLSSWGDFLQST